MPARSSAATGAEVEDERTGAEVEDERACSRAPARPQSAARRSEADSRSAAAAEAESVRAAAAEQRIRMLEVQVRHLEDAAAP